MSVIELEDYNVKFQLTEDKKTRIVERLIDWCIMKELFSSESLRQANDTDNVLLEWMIDIVGFEIVNKGERQTRVS